MLEQLAARELLPQQSPLDKTIEEIGEKIEKAEKIVVNLHGKSEYDIYMRNSKQAINYGLVLKKVQRNH